MAGARLVTRRTPSKSYSAAHATSTTHGLTTLKRAVKALGGRTIDRRTSLGKALSQWRAELIRDLGGESAISTQERALVDLAVKSKLLLDSVDAWLLTQTSLVNARKRALYPVVRERVQLSDALSRYLAQLGLKRRAKPAVPLGEMLAAKARTRSVDDGDGPGAATAVERAQAGQGEEIATEWQGEDGRQDDRGANAPYGITSLEEDLMDATTVKARP